MPPTPPAVYSFTPKHRWSLQNHLLSGITIIPWLKLLLQHGRDIDWRLYWHRVAFLTLLSLFNTLLAVVDFLHYHRAIRAQPVNPEPVFVLGHPRTGTTHIQNLLALDPNYASITTLQAGFPSGFLCIRKYRWALGWMVSGTRPMDAMPLSLDTPAEDEIGVNALTGGVSPYMALMFMRKHREFTKYCTFQEAGEEDLDAWVTAFIWLLKKVTYANGGCKPLIIKSPVHMGRIRLFQRMFPAARYVFVHRDPLDVFASSAHMADTYFWYCALQLPSDEDTTNYILEQHDALYGAYLRDRECIDAANLIEVPFSELDTNPLTTMEKVYQRLKLGEFAAVRPVLEGYLGQIEGFKKNDHKFLKPSLRARIERAWSGVFTEFGYRRVS